MMHKKNNNKFELRLFFGQVQDQKKKTKQSTTQDIIQTRAFLHSIKNNLFYFYLYDPSQVTIENHQVINQINKKKVKG